MNIRRLIPYLRSSDKNRHLKEIIVSDGGSRDKTVTAAEALGAKVVRCSSKGRASQMNAGADVAQGPILYFLHADSVPPPCYADDIVKAVAEQYKSGCYRLRFDDSHWFLSANCWFTRFDINAVRFGDQSLFVSRAVFSRAGGFNSAMKIMEDQEIIGRIKKHTQFQVLDNCITTSARTYLENGVFRLQLIFLTIFLLHKVGCTQGTLVRVYRSLICQYKV